MTASGHDEIGQLAESNMSRFTDPVVTEALATFRGSSDEAVQKEAVNEIAGVVIEQVPFVPLNDRVNFSNFNLSTFTGWPSLPAQFQCGCSLTTGLSFTHCAWWIQKAPWCRFPAQNSAC